MGMDGEGTQCSGWTISAHGRPSVLPDPQGVSASGGADYLPPLDFQHYPVIGVIGEGDRAADNGNACFIGRSDHHCRIPVVFG